MVVRDVLFPGLQNRETRGTRREGFSVYENRKPSEMRRAFLSSSGQDSRLGYFGGCGVKISRLVGSGFGLGFGAFLASLRPLSLLPMCDSLP